MIIPSSSFASFSSVKKPVAGGGGSDVTPNAVNWVTTLFCDDMSPCQDYTEQQITGINQTISISFSVSSSSGTTPIVAYRKATTPGSVGNGGYCDASTQYGFGSGSDSGLNYLTLYNGSLVVSGITLGANDYLGFIAFGQANPFPPATHQVVIQITNTSDSNTVLDTITFEQV